MIRKFCAVCGSKDDLLPITRKRIATRCIKCTNINTQKMCTHCNEVKPLNEFSVHPHGFLRRISYCKLCGQHMSRPYKKAVYKARKLLKTCVRCNKPLMVTSNIFCNNCWWKDTSARTTGSSGNHVELQALFNQQNKKCFYTNTDLIEGDNLSIDHQIPKVLGGTNDTSNLRFVERTVNNMKGSLTHQEFISLCVKIAQHFT
mgnify:CR=1 FL=1